MKVSEIFNLGIEMGIKADFRGKQGVEKFVQISTDEVYGQIENGSFKENDMLKPRNPYSAAKAAGELLAMSYYTTFDLPVIVTRSSNNYGLLAGPGLSMLLATSAVTTASRHGLEPLYIH